MKRLALGLAAACLTVGVAAAQTNTSTSTSTGTGATLGTPNAGQTGKAAASGDSNQVVATTNANASQPAHGSNSFTADQARGRIEDQGFANVTDLQKDSSGVWRGKAQKGGQTVSVWLDYKGNVGQ